jgi:3alpha(or 20beta)-hydroxysteroid dehydrogenase
MGRLDDKVAIVTGASRGVGAATSRAFVAEGATVVVADIVDERAEALADELGERAIAAHCDVGNEDDWAALVSTTVDRLGTVDVLANVAGAIFLGLIADTPLQEYLRVNRVNEVGTFLGIRSVIPTMTAAGRGSIINYSSVEAFHVVPFTAAYAASKFAIRGLTQAAAMELGGSGIRVNCVCGPGGSAAFVSEAPMSDTMQQFQEARATRSSADTADVNDGSWGNRSAATMVFLACDDSLGYNGADFVLDNGAAVGTSLDQMLRGAGPYS